MVDINSFLNGSLITGIVAAIGVALKILLSKRVKSREDETRDQARLDREYNAMMEGYKEDLANAKKEMATSVQALRTEMKEQKQEFDEKFEAQGRELEAVKAENLALERYIYRCIAVIQRVGKPEDIPLPPPTKIQP